MVIFSQRIVDTSYSYNTEMAKKFRDAVISERSKKKIVNFNKCNPIDGIAADVIIDGKTFISILDELLRFREFWIGSICSFQSLKDFYLELNLKYVHKNDLLSVRYCILRSKLEDITETVPLYNEIFDKLIKESEKIYSSKAVY